MANISKCAVCGKDVPKHRDIQKDANNQPYRLCTDNCFDDFMKREVALDAEAAEWDSRCAKAIKRGEAESGRKFEDAGDALIMSWIDKYAYTDENATSEG